MRRRTSKNRLLCLVLAASLLCGVLSGCTGSPAENSAGNSAPSGASSGSANAGEDVTLRFAWWGSDPRHEATLAAIAKYEELNPNVKIEGEYQGYDGYQQKLMTQIAGRTEPDLMQLDYVWYPELAAQGDNFVDLSSDANIDLSGYAESVLKDYCSIDGKVIALPMGSNGFGTMINTAFFEKHNIPVDTEWTWESMIGTGAKIHADNPDDYLFAIESGTSTGGIGPFILSAYLYNQTGEYWADQDTYTINASKEDLTKAFDILFRLFDSGAAQPLGEASLFTGQMEQNPKWLNGEMGFTVDWSSTVNKYKTALGEKNFAVGKPPFVEGGDNKNISFKPSMVLAVSKNSKYTDIATDFVNWFLSDPEAVKLLGTQRSVPTNQDAFELLNKAGAIDADVAAMVANTDASPAAPVPLVQSNTEVADVVKDICERVVFGEISPADAAAKFLSDVQAKLDTLK